MALTLAMAGSFIQASRNDLLLFLNADQPPPEGFLNSRFPSFFDLLPLHRSANPEKLGPIGLNLIYRPIANDSFARLSVSPTYRCAMPCNRSPGPKSRVKTQSSSCQEDHKPLGLRTCFLDPTPPTQLVAQCGHVIRLIDMTSGSQPPFLVQLLLKTQNLSRSSKPTKIRKSGKRGK
jgi:hypothetical protein